MFTIEVHEGVLVVNNTQRRTSRDIREQRVARREHDWRNAGRVGLAQRHELVDRNASQVTRAPIGPVHPHRIDRCRLPDAGSSPVEMPDPVPKPVASKQVIHT